MRLALRLSCLILAACAVAAPVDPTPRALEMSASVAVPTPPVGYAYSLDVVQPQYTNCGQAAIGGLSYSHTPYTANLAATVRTHCPQVVFCGWWVSRDGAPWVPFNAYPQQPVAVSGNDAYLAVFRRRGTKPFPEC